MRDERFQAKVGSTASLSLDWDSVLTKHIAGGGLAALNLKKENQATVEQDGNQVRPLTPEDTQMADTQADAPAT